MSKQTKISIAFEKTENVSIDDLVPFQGELKSLSKENYERLKKEIIETGFAFPFHVWRDASVNKIYIIGGHQRLRALKQMRDEGFTIPKVPANFIKAKSYKEAKRRVLQDVSQYGHVERQGLYEFMHEAEIDVDDLLPSFSIPEIEMNLNLFKMEFFLESKQIDPQEEWQGMPEFNQEDKTSYRHVVIHFKSEEDASNFFKLIGHKDTGKTRSLWFPFQENMDTESKRYE